MFWFIETRKKKEEPQKATVICQTIIIYMGGGQGQLELPYCL